MDGKSQVRTRSPDGVDTQYLGTLGPVSALTFGFTVPGGCDQLSCVVGTDPAFRAAAFDRGRTVEVLRGGDVVWDGIANEPQPGDTGWTITAHGSGTYGASYAAEYSGAWGSGVVDTIVNGAISRGLGWVNPGVGSPSGLWLGQAPDSASMQVDAVLNQVCGRGGLTWWVKRVPRGPLLQVFALPTTPNRLLICTTPQGRTIGDDVNVLKIRYQTSLDGGGTPATYATTTAIDTTQVARHTKVEEYLDLSSVGVLTASAAQAVGLSILQRYQRAQYAGPFTAHYGQWLTIGGQPADLGCFFIGTEGPPVVQLMMLDQGWGGEVKPGPQQFLVGQYDYDEDAGTVTVTPFADLKSDFASYLSERAGLVHGRTKRHHRKKRFVPGGHGKPHRNHARPG